VTAGDRVGDLRPGRVEEGDQSQQAEVALGVLPPGGFAPS
jgi:hypothetical protein